VLTDKEASMLRTFNSMTLTLGGSLRPKQIKSSLQKLGLDPSDQSASAMIRSAPPPPLPPSAP
jgi:hypothetical protein